ncbi:SDR family oxidoreductase [Mycolicibacterium smegmatis]|nr:SDR family oxidoreductase [Mycolicibacterium smegmatis]ABK73044.1 oxidoreductase [Mycolicibacterium smegmatis MC2 155]AIU11820.1 oxidoreductase [Mycolicibacterium smegmatis MC2 155]AIU18445.1 oxidoreductase [Mycolicibacterium smegmatis]AIU25067.1 oxidoreductase [Mycolicibacterium smegmatis]MBE9616118.1 SDR family oxidoreductase [Mycolicibacterium smegmatis]
MTGKRLADTVALVTGASSGIGWATARALAAEGATVAVFGRRLARLEELVDVIERDGGRAHAHEVDVTDGATVARSVQAIADEFGRIDILVNNAGFLANAPAVEADLADWHRTIDVNIGGVLNVTHAALPLVVRAGERERGVADIVTVSSVGGRRVPGPSSNVYAASKHAVGAFTEALRQELATRRVRVGVVEPGVVRTEMTTGGSKGAPDATTGAPLDPADIASAIVYMVTRPAHAAVNEILIRPTEQVI